MSSQKIIIIGCYQICSNYNYGEQTKFANLPRLNGNDKKWKLKDWLLNV